MVSRSTKNWLVATVVAPLLVFGGFWVSNRSNVDTSNSAPPAATAQSEYTPNYVTVKYRDGDVDVANPRFEYLDTSTSSFVQGAWYDFSEQYMIINLNGTNYHYCSLPSSVWQEFMTAESFGSYYNSDIKGYYDCRENPVPNYE